MILDVVIPTHNRSGLLARCLESVERARVPAELSIAIHVVDNRSTDDTKEVVLDFQRRSHLPVHYFFAPRRGKSAALNDAVPKMTAEVLGFIDDDEEIDPSWFEVAYREFSGDSSIEYIGGPCLPNWEMDPPDWLPEGFRGVIGIVPRPDRVPFSHNFEGMLMGGNVVIRKSTLERVLPYPEKLGKFGKKIRSGQDEVIYHRLLAIGANGMVVPDLIIRHWIPAERMTKKYHRRWALGRGISVGMQLRERGFREPPLLGIPRYYFGAMIRSGIPAFFSTSAKKRLAAQLKILDCVGTLYGRHFYR